MCPGPGPHSPGSRHVPHPAQPHAHKHTPAVSQARTRHTQSTHSHKLTSSRAPHCVRLGHTELLSAPQTGLPWAFTHTHTRTHTCTHTRSCTHRRAHTRTHGLRCSWNILRTGDSHARPLASPAHPQPWSGHPTASGSLSAARTLPSSTVPATHGPPSPEEKAVSSPKPRASGLRPCVGPTLPAPSRTVSHGSSPGSAWKLLFTTSQCQLSPRSRCGAHPAPSQDCSRDVGSQVGQVPKHYLFGGPEGHPTSSTASPHFSPLEVVTGPGPQERRRCFPSAHTVSVVRETPSLEVGTVLLG